MDIVLLHPPPWPGPEMGRGPEPPRFAGPLGQDQDFLTIPYGLLSLAAQALRAGHNLVLLNLSSFSWSEVETILARARADLYGMSCYTSNRFGVDAAARLIRRLHPGAHVTAGGPQVTALPRQTLEHFTALDTVVVGEGEDTFLELVERLERGRGPRGLAGCAWREDEDIILGPPRPRIDELDRLAHPLEYFPSPIVITSRGCPARCSFCASQVLWGRKLRFHSARYVLDIMERAVQARGLKALAIKDDTFTADRGRALAICRGMVERGLNLVWSCDTRADFLDQELLEHMRRAGCQQISLGVESGSQRILDNIRKRITPEQVARVTALAREMGIFVRYYLMVGNRGEDRRSLAQTVEFLQRTQPDDYLFALLTIYPGTEEFDLLCQTRPDMDGDFFYTHDLVELEMFAGRPEQAQEIIQEVLRLMARRQLRRPGVEQCRRVLERFPDLHLAHLDLGAACFRAREFDNARQHLDQALALGYPFASVVLNYLAAIAVGEGDALAADLFLKRAGEGPPEALIRRNRRALETWRQGGKKDPPPILEAAHEFQFVSQPPFVQPIKPAPIRLRALAGGGDLVLGRGPA